MLNGFLRRLSSEQVPLDPTAHSNDIDTSGGHRGEAQPRSMRARAGSIKLPLYATSNGPKLREKRDISPDSVEYRHAKPHSRRTARAWRAWLLWALQNILPGRRTTSYSRLLRYLIIGAVFVLLVVWWLYEIQVEIFFYSRRWIDREILSLEPLAGCFDPQRVSPRYNLTEAFGPKSTEVQAGIPLRMGLDCYDLAATIPSSHQPPSHLISETVYFHTYWRSDLAPFEERQEWLLKSFFATQDLSRSILILWSNGDLRKNPYVIQWLTRYPDSLQLRIVDVDQLAVGTALEGSPLLHQKDKKAWIDGDLIRLLVVWAFGGVWVDMDSLLTRDLHPLLEHEFFTQWDCYDKKYRPFNGALLHFNQHSPYLCEAFHIMATSAPPKPGSVEWGSLLYLKLWRRLLAAGIPPFKILPFCFSDARSCRLDNRLPDPFKKDPNGGRWPLRGPRIESAVADMDVGGPLDLTLQKVFSVHLHNQWNKAFPPGGWVDRLLLSRYERKLNTPS